MKLMIRSEHLAVAMIYMAKNDARPYLNGIHLNKEGWIQATNGHQSVRIACPALKALDENIIICPDKGAIPKSADIAEIDFESKTIRFTASGSSIKTIGFILVDGRYPDLNRIYNCRAPGPVDSIGLNPKYLADLQKIAAALGLESMPPAKLEFRGRVGSVRITFPHCASYGIEILLMPCKL